MRLALLALLAAGPAHGYELKQRLERLLGPAYPPHNIGQVYVTLRRLETSGLIENAGPVDAGPEPQPAPPAPAPPAVSASPPGPAPVPAPPAGSTAPAPPSAGRPQHRRTYRLTAAGREAVAAWFEQPAEPPRARSEFFLKLALAPVSGMAEQVTLIDRQRRHHLTALRQLTPLTRAEPEPERSTPVPAGEVPGSRAGDERGPEHRPGSPGEQAPERRPERDPRIARLLAVGAALHLQADLDWLEHCQRELE